MKKKYFIMALVLLSSLTSLEAGAAEKIKELNYKNLLNKKNTKNNPLEEYPVWLKAMTYSQIDDQFKNGTALLGTLSEDGMKPQVRAVSIEKTTKNAFIFYSDVHATKIKELQKNPHATLVFLWRDSGSKASYQITAEGIVTSYLALKKINYRYQSKTKTIHWQAYQFKPNKMQYAVYHIEGSEAVIEYLNYEWLKNHWVKNIAVDDLIIPYKE